MRRLSLILTVLLLLLTAPALAATRYVDGTLAATCSGSTYSIASRNCTGSDGTGYKTLPEGWAALVASDVLFIRAGTYTLSSVYGDVASETWGSGATSWATATRITNYPSEAVVIKHRGLQFKACNYSPAVLKYVIFEGDTRANLIQELDAGSNLSGLNISCGTDHVRIKTMTIRNFTENGIVGGGTPAPSFIEIVDNLITNNGDLTAQEHGIYPSSSSNWLVERNDIVGNQGYGIHFNSTTGPHINATIRYNRIEGRRTGATGTAGCIVVNGSAGSSGNVIVYNLCLGQGSQAVKFNNGIQVGGAGNVGTVAYNNTIYDVSSTGIQVSSSGASNTLIKNNIFDDTPTSINDLGTSTVKDFNLCDAAQCDSSGVTNTVVTATPGFVSPGTDFTLAAGSAAINAGTPLAGYSYNGAAPDLGAFEFFTFTSGSCVGQTCDVQMDMNLNTPFIPGTTGFSLDATRTITNVELIGSSIARLTYTGTCTGGNVSYDDATGTATDSALIGGTLNQRLWDTGPVALTNNCGGAAYTFTQTAGAIYSGLGAQTTTSQITHVSAGGMVAVRTKFKATGAAPPAITSKLQYSVTGEAGTFVDIPDTFGAGNIRYVGLATYKGMDLHGTATTERLASEFTGLVAGAVERCITGCETPAVLLTQNSESEQVDIVEFDTDTAVDTVYWFRRIQSDGTVMTYAANSKPSITIKAPSASGFASLSDQPSGMTVTPNPTRSQPPSPGWLADAEPSSSLASWSAGSGLKLDGRPTR